MKLARHAKVVAAGAGAVVAASVAEEDEVAAEDAAAAEAGTATAEIEATAAGRPSTYKKKCQRNRGARASSPVLLFREAATLRRRSVSALHNQVTRYVCGVKWFLQKTDNCQQIKDAVSNDNGKGSP